MVCITLTRIAAGLALAAVIPRIALAGDWQYCLAAAHAEHKVYISAPFPEFGAAGAADRWFTHRLEQAEIPYDDVQCPRAEDETAIMIMRRHAIGFNRHLGNTIVAIPSNAN